VVVQVTPPSKETSTFAVAGKLLDNERGELQTIASAVPLTSLPPSLAATGAVPLAVVLAAPVVVVVVVLAAPVVAAVVPVVVLAAPVVEVVVVVLLTVTVMAAESWSLNLQRTEIPVLKLLPNTVTVVAPYCGP